jgi:chemotaxis protein MotB
MSADGDAPVTHEVVIVRRRSGGEDEGHHGGAWKIAFADLMTAMMTFFLVMWLLNISDKEKITKIATYFNPTKLSEKTPSVKGVDEPIEEETSKRADSKDYRPPVEDSKEDHKAKMEEEKGDGKAKKGDPKKAEEELFNDPYGVLARMALKAMERGELANGGTKQGDELLPGGEAYRNPFEPYAADKPLAEQPAPATPDAAGVEARVSAKTAEGEAAKEAAPADAGTPSNPASATPADPAKAAEEKAAVDGLAKDIVKSLEGLTSQNTPNIEVQKTDEGLLVSLMDDFRFGMFGLSSATPAPEVVVVMERIAKVLAGRPGQIVLRGHTDGRPFKSGRNDNWRLSMDRARVAFYMLTRGGLDEKRIERIEGHADHTLKVSGDPNAAGNRRIEILLKVPKT